MGDPIYRDELAWAAAWSNGSPHPFIITNSVRYTRSAVIEYLGAHWARQDETEGQGWKRAYRQGCRIVRVRIQHATEGASHDR